MLTCLHLENMAVIESADIEFAPGFNVLTGETGAGKSIIVDSISAVLGGRISRDIIRSGAQRAVVSALFCDLSPQVLEPLSEIGAAPDEDGCILLQRTVTPDGRGSFRLNGRPSTAAVFRAAAPYLVNIHGQHDSQLLLNESTHLRYLDAYAGAGAALSRYREKYALYTETKRALAALNTDEAEKARRMDMLRFQIQQLERARLTPGEEEKLYQRRTILTNSEKLSKALGEASSLLSGNGDAPGTAEAVEQAANALRRVAHVSEEIEKTVHTLDELYYTLFDSAQQIETISANIEYSERELDAIESRLDILNRLGKRYGAGTKTMLAYLEKIKRELDEMESSDERRAQLEKECTLRYNEALSEGEALSALREKAALSLEKDIIAQLVYLDMPRALFKVDLQRVANDESQLTPDGIDRAAFNISVNAGEAPKPLSRIASGGELSRIMLAIKNVLASGDGVGTMVFDEIDTGISGRAAGKAARRIASLSRNRQVLSVTHLTQIAAMGDRHFFIEKTERDGRSYTNVRILDNEQRARELARISSGESVTRASIDAANELLSECAQFKAEEC